MDFRYLQSLLYNIDSNAIQVVAPADVPAYEFTVGGSVAIASQAQFTLVANGVSAAPTFGPGLTNVGGDAQGYTYANVAGVPYAITLFHDGWDGYYQISTNSGPLYPSPISFVGGNNTATLTITFAGASLSTSSIPPPSAFSLTGSRPGTAAGTVVLPLPYQVANVASVTATSVGLTVTGGRFLDGDTVFLSYLPCARTTTTGPLQDAPTGQYKCPGWTAAAVTVE